MNIELTEEEIDQIMVCFDSMNDADRDYLDDRNPYRSGNEVELSQIRNELSIRENLQNRLRERMNPRDYLK